MSPQAHGLTVDNILKTDATTLNSLICQVGFHNNKTKFIAEATRILKEQHDSDVPRTLEELVSLPGVGPKMAFITLSAAHGIDVGIGIDTHMHRSMVYTLPPVIFICFGKRRLKYITVA